MAITSTRIPSVLPCLLTVIAMVLPSCLGRIGDDVYCHYETEPKHGIACMIGDPDGPVTLVYSHFYKLRGSSTFSSSEQREALLGDPAGPASLRKDGTGLRMTLDGHTAYLSRTHRLGPAALMGVDYVFGSFSPNCFAAVDADSLSYTLLTNGTLKSRKAPIQDDGTTVSDDIEFALLSVSSFPNRSLGVFLLGRTQVDGSTRFFIMKGDPRPGYESEYWTRQSIESWLEQTALEQSAVLERPSTQMLLEHAMYGVVSAATHGKKLMVRPLSDSAANKMTFYRLRLTSLFLLLSATWIQDIGHLPPVLALREGPDTPHL
ncbi:hypothetical protein FOZ61_003584 [Perkinsus olseni]|uniref:Uncharacterized protein n=1 Tax=Perkinsus olseni TaxID=32597 RepID=A0A7J6LPY1_PEROL|nr:hypothetical protein FOL46_000209 [Perkinsus olseni]KAF4661080.1 hypothetical protein FOZ61_003584 [Perkinsus olseni]